MTSGTKNILQKYPLLLVLLIAIVLVVFAAWLNSSGHETVQAISTQVNNSTQPTKSITPSVTPNISMPSKSASTPPPVITSVSLLESTPLPLVPTHFIGTLGPDKFEVRKWFTDACDPYSRITTIRGLAIVGNFIPYKFTFQQSTEVFVPVFIYFQIMPTSLATSYRQDSLLERFILFNEPVKVEKNRYVHITIDFEPEGDQLPWIDDLLFPAENCSSK